VSRAVDVSLLVLGKGTVGRHLFAQIAAARARLETDHDVLVRVVGARDSAGGVFDRDGIDPASAAAILARRRRAASFASRPADRRDEPGLLESLDRLGALPVPVLVDCTGEDGMEATYEAALDRGIHVVAANKRPLAGPLSTWRSLRATARRARRSYRYETAVGAGLPVIETLKNLVRTGDRVRRIEGSLSGTLGYVAGALMEGERLSAIVRRARDLGYTEPHPGEDLRGADVSRKALILARELGEAASIEDVRVTPLVPSRLLDERDPARFDAALATYDGEMAGVVDSARRDGRVLRYLATVDAPGDGRRASLSAGPALVPLDHPAAHLAGAESFVAFYTDRYADQPLVVRGAGAGGAVTAAGVLADVLAVAGGAGAGAPRA